MKLILTIALLSFVFHTVTAQWESCKFPEGTDVIALGFTGNTVLAGVSGGIYYADNKNLSWSQIQNPSIRNSRASGFVEDGDSVFATIFGRGVYLSPDHGATWIQKASGPSFASARCILVQGKTLFVGTDGSIYKSVDYGATWQQSYTANMTAEYVHCLLDYNGIIIAGTQNQFLVSVDTGKTWTSKLVYESVQDFEIIGTTIYAGMVNGGIMKSDDAGQSWTAMNNGIPGKDKKVSELEVINNRLYAGSELAGVFYSDDLGATWTLMPTPFTVSSNGVRLKAMEFKNDTMYLGYDQGKGIYRSTDHGSSWTKHTSGMYHVTVQNIGAIDSMVVIGYANEIFASYNNGKTWSPTGGDLTGDMFYDFIKFKNEKYLAAGNGLWRFSNPDKKWYHTGYQRSVNVIKEVNGILYTSDNAEFYSSPDATNWNPVTTLPGTNVSDIEEFQNNVYVDLNGHYTIRGLYYSSDNGLTWTFSSSAGDYDHIAASENKIFYGDNWANSPEGPWQLHSVPNIYNCVEKKGILYSFIQGSSHIYYSIDEGDTWTDVGAGLDGKYVYNIAISDSFLFAATNGYGVYRLALPDNGVVINSVKDSGIESMINVFPNPGTEKITLSLPEEMKESKLTLFSSDGSKEWHVEKTSLGVINISELSSGIYFLRVENENRSVIKRIEVK